MNLRRLVVALLALLFHSSSFHVSSSLLAQDRLQLQKQFEAGRFQEVVDAATAVAPPEVLYLAGQSLQKLGARVDAADVYRLLAERRESDPWRFVGESARVLVQGNAEAAVAAARRGVQLGPNLADAHVQLGLALATRQEWSAAASAFERAIELAPEGAYAYYYAGLMLERSNQHDRMVRHLDRFLALAPQAPERAEVVRILRR